MATTWVKQGWEAILRKAIAALLGKDWKLILVKASELMNSDLPGKEKRQIVYNAVVEAGSDAVFWLIYAGIEVAVGILVASQDKTVE